MLKNIPNPKQSISHRHRQYQKNLYPLPYMAGKRGNLRRMYRELPEIYNYRIGWKVRIISIDIQ
jgi:hypothetical protein